MRGYRERDVHAHTWHRSNDVEIHNPPMMNMAKDCLSCMWFDKPVLSQVKGPTTFGETR